MAIDPIPLQLAVQPDLGVGSTEAALVVPGDLRVRHHGCDEFQICPRKLA